MIGKNYIEYLFNEPRGEADNDYIDSETQLERTREEVEHMIKGIKTGKAAGPDALATEVIQPISDHI